MVVACLIELLSRVIGQSGFNAYQCYNIKFALMLRESGISLGTETSCGVLPENLLCRNMSSLTCLNSWLLLAFCCFSGNGKNF